MGIYIFKRKTFTRYDDTDNLKRMKDSDILAEKKRTPDVSAGTVGAAAGAGALAGAAIGVIPGAIRGGNKFRNAVARVDAGSTSRKLTNIVDAGKWSSVKRGIGGGAKAGALIGGAILAGSAIKKRNQAKKDASFYNDRLEYAQRQAIRREKADWKANMTQRDGYSY